MMRSTQFLELQVRVAHDSFPKKSNGLWVGLFLCLQLVPVNWIMIVFTLAMGDISHYQCRRPIPSMVLFMDVHGLSKTRKNLRLDALVGCFTRIVFLLPPLKRWNKSCFGTRFSTTFGLNSMPKIRGFFGGPGSRISRTPRTPMLSEHSSKALAKMSSKMRRTDFEAEPWDGPGWLTMTFVGWKLQNDTTINDWNPTGDEPDNIFESNDKGPHCRYMSKSLNPTETKEHAAFNFFWLPWQITATSLRPHIWCLVEGNHPDITSFQAGKYPADDMGGRWWQYILCMGQAWPSAKQSSSRQLYLDFSYVLPAWIATWMCPCEMFIIGFWIPGLTGLTWRCSPFPDPWRRTYHTFSSRPKSRWRIAVANGCSGCWTPWATSGDVIPWRTPWAKQEAPGSTCSPPCRAAWRWWRFWMPGR